jgi:hypothetical protein
MECDQNHTCAPDLAGAMWGAINDLHGATSGVFKHSKYAYDLLRSRSEPHWPTPEPSFASKGFCRFLGATTYCFAPLICLDVAASTTTYFDPVTGCGIGVGSRRILLISVRGHGDHAYLSSQ